MSLLDNIEKKSLSASEEIRRSIVSANLTDPFNPERFEYAILIGADEHRNWMPCDLKMRLEQLFSGYGDFRFQEMFLNVLAFEPIIENAKQYGIKTYKNDNYVVMFNFRGNQMVQARMIISLCAILKTCFQKLILDFQPLIRMYVKCDPTHRGNPDVWWPPLALIPEATIKHIASRTAAPDVKTREIEDFARRYFLLDNRDYEYVDKVQERLKRLYPNNMKKWFFNE